MVAVIKSSASIQNVLQYNENKLKQNVAELIHSVNYGKDTAQLGLSDKLRTLEKFISLNERAKLNAVHISLNFDPSEKLDKETLCRIAETYMQRIGFANQPYLVYQHHDAGHPHLHLVTTNIQRNGKRISMQNIGRNQSEKARKEIEIEFTLVKAQDHGLKQPYEIKPLHIQKVQYGKSDTRRAITTVLDAILPAYKYASLPELNAVLRQYNIVADRGKEGSRLYNSNGLLYRILNEKGEKIGIPIKASQIYNKPTLKFLQEKFIKNEAEKQRFKQRLRNTIDFAFVKHPNQSLQHIIATLFKERIQVVLRQNDQGIIYGLTYIDHATKCVFNGSDLGKLYSANGIQQRCSKVAALTPQKKPQETLTQQPIISGLKELVKELTQAEYETQLSPEIQSEQEAPLSPEMKREQFKKRKRKRLHH